MPSAKPVTLTFTINAPLDPLGRGEHFEDPLYNWLEHQGAEIVDGGGGTMLHDDGRTVSDFFVQFNGRSYVRSAIRFVRSLGVPIGSSFRIDDGDENDFGDRKCVEFSVKKPARFGPKQIGKLYTAVENAVQVTGKLLAAKETNGRLLFLVYGVDPAEVRTALEPLMREYSKIDARAEEVA